jgi:hypothetical protein
LERKDALFSRAGKTLSEAIIQIAQTGYPIILNVLGIGALKQCGDIKVTLNVNP